MSDKEEARQLLGVMVGLVAEMKELAMRNPGWEKALAYNAVLSAYVLLLAQEVHENG